jgi:chromosome partitioning protein
MAKDLNTIAKTKNPFEVLDNLGLGQDPEKVIAVDTDAFTKALDGKHQRTIAVVNYKGGVGKTTATFFLGAQIAHHEPKKKVLIIDIDAQCSLTTVFGQDPIVGNEQNVLVLLKGGKAISPASIKKEAFVKKGKYGTGIPANLFLLSGAFEVEDLDYELAQDRTMSKDDFFKQCRRVLALFHDFDYIFVDCPPNKMFLTQGMLRACSHYVLVAIPDKVSTYGIPRLLNWVEQIPIESRPKLVGALINRVIRTSKGITDEQERWLVAIQNTVSKRALLTKNRGVLGLWPNSNNVCKVYGSGKSHLATSDIWESGSRQAAVGDCVAESAAHIIFVCK